MIGPIKLNRSIPKPPPPKPKSTTEKNDASSGGSSNAKDNDSSKTESGSKDTGGTASGSGQSSTGNQSGAGGKGHPGTISSTSASTNTSDMQELGNAADLKFKSDVTAVGATIAVGAAVTVDDSTTSSTSAPSVEDAVEKLNSAIDDRNALPPYAQRFGEQRVTDAKGQLDQAVLNEISNDDSSDTAEEKAQKIADRFADNPVGLRQIESSVDRIMPLAQAAEEEAADAEAADEVQAQLVEEGYTNEEAEAIIEDLDQLKTGDQQEQVEAVFSLAAKLPSDKIQELTKELGVEDNAVAKLLGDSKALGAVATLASDDASGTEKLVATVTLLESAGDLAPESLTNALKKPLAALSSGQEIIKFVETTLDPDASLLDKAEAGLTLANAIKGSIGTAFPGLKQELRRLDSLGNSLSAALTIVDSDASLKERSEAVFELFANVPDVKNDLGEFQGRLLDGVLGKHVDLDELTEPGSSLPGYWDDPKLENDLTRALDPELRESLTAEQADRFNAISKDVVDGDDNPLIDVLRNTEDPKSIDLIFDAVEAQDDVPSQRALLNSLEGLKPGQIDDLVASTVDGKPAAIVLGETVSKLSPDGQKAFNKLVSNFDNDSINFLTKVGSKIDANVLDDLVKVADKFPIKGVNEAFKFFDNALGKLGVEITGDIAGRLAKGLTKLIPGVGAIPAAIDAAKALEIAADDSYPPDIRQLAAINAKINGADVVTSAIETFTAQFGVPIAVDLAVGGAALLTDLVLTDQLAKFEEAKAEGREYEPPALLTTANVAVAGASGPTGWVEFWGIYGADDGIKAISTAVETAGSGAIDAAEGLAILGTEAVGAGLELTAEGLHVLADVIRNPEVYGEKAVEFGKQAVETLSNIAQGAGELAKEAGELLLDTVDDLKELGEQGLETLQWIAENPTEAATKAVEAIGDVASEALEKGTAAARAVAEKALDALDTLRDVGGKVADAVSEATEKLVDNLVDLGEKGVEAIAWIANNPGEAAEIAKDTLVDIASKGGELAKAAYDGIVALGEKGIELANDVADKLIELGEDGIELLGYIAQNPGEAATRAIEGLGNLARNAGEAGKKAAGELLDAAGAGIEAAKEVATELLAEGVDSVVNVVKSLGTNVGEGLVAVLEGALDVADALSEQAQAAASALVKLANSGLQSAKDAATNLLNKGKDAVVNAIVDLGNDIGEGIEDVINDLGDAAKRSALAAQSVVKLVDGGIDAAADIATDLLLDGAEVFVDTVAALGDTISDEMKAVVNGLGALVEEAGEYAEAAGEALVALGEGGLALAQDIAGGLVDAGKWVGSNAASAAQWAADGLGDLYNGTIGRIPGF